MGPKSCDHRGLELDDTLYIESSDDLGYNFEHIRNIKYCPICGEELLSFEAKHDHKLSQLKVVGRWIDVRDKSNISKYPDNGYYYLVTIAEFVNSYLGYIYETDYIQYRNGEWCTSRDVVAYLDVEPCQLDPRG